MQDITINKIYRSRRRTMALVITRQAEVIIRAPFGVSERNILHFVNKKAAWILAKKKFVQDHLKNMLRRTFAAGELIIFLGKEYPLIITTHKAIRVTEFFEFPKRFLKSPERHLTNWYRLKAKEHLQARCEFFAAKMGVQFQSIKISSARQRLGSCSNSNNLNFSWHLIKAPQEVVDYVVIHELCHIEIKNHSSDFWKKVSVYIPHYKDQKKWIKGHFSKLLY